MKVTRHFLPMFFITQATVQRHILSLPINAHPLAMREEQDFDVLPPERTHVLYVVSEGSVEVEERPLLVIGTGEESPDLTPDAVFLGTIYDLSIRHPLKQARHFFLLPAVTLESSQ